MKVATNVGESFSEQLTDSFTTIDETGATYRVFDFGPQSEYDRITIKFTTDDSVPHQLRVYNTRESDTPDETIAFRDRRVSFDPISVIGKNDAEQLQGLSPTIQSYDEIPDIIKETWKSIGFSVIPEGDEWSV